MKRILLFAAAMAIALLPWRPAAVMAADGPAPAHLTAADHKILDRVAAYLNSVSTMKSRFLQISSNGGEAQGTVYLSRPGKLRIEYDPPNPVLIVCDGVYLNYWDKELKQATYLKLSDTPAEFLLQKDLSFNDPKVTVLRVSNANDVIRVTVERTGQPQQGQLTFVFEDKPLELRKWVVVDAQDVTTQVSLLNPQFGVKLEPSLFQFAAPLNLQGPKN